MLGTVLEDIGLQPDGWAWDALIYALSAIWFLLLGAWIWGLIRQRRSQPDAEEEFASFLAHFTGWEAMLAQQGRQLNLAELTSQQWEQLERSTRSRPGVAVSEAG